MIDPQKVIANQARMERFRGNWDSTWREIAALVYPAVSKAFTGQMKQSQFMRGQPAATTAHDPYTTLALRDGVSVFEGFVMPRGQRWQGFELGDTDLMKQVPVQQWCDDLSLALFKLRNDPESGFVKATHKSALSLIAFGPQSLWIDERRDVMGRLVGLSYQSEFIGDIYCDRDANGNVMRLHRRISLNAEQALAKWGDKLPPKVAAVMTGPNARPETEFSFLHVIEPNRAMDPERIDWMGKPWHGGYMLECEPGHGLFDQGGYHSLPRIFSSFATEGEAGYGNSPTQLVLPYVRSQQQMLADRMLGAELRLLPPLLTSDDTLDNAVLEMRALGVTEGGLDDRGQPLVQEFLTAADGNEAKELTGELRAAIDRVYWRDLLQLNREYKSHIPAARIEEEKAEKGLLLSPLAEQEQEWLSPMTKRELLLMDDLGLVPEMPGAVAEYLDAAGKMAIKYDNGLSAMQEASKSAAFLSLAGQVAPLAQFDPSYVQDFRREYPSHRVLPELGRIAGVPAAMRATDEDKAAFDDAKMQEAQMQQLLQAAPALAGAAKDMTAAAQPVGI